MKFEVFAVSMYEYERGWGSKLDGHLFFLDKSSALKFIRCETDDRDPNKVPDCYVYYQPCGMVECHPDLIESIICTDDKRVYMDTIQEAMLSAVELRVKYKMPKKTPIEVYLVPTWPVEGERLIHDWRTHVPLEVRIGWHSFTGDQKQVLYSMFKNLSDKEEHE